MTPSPSITKSGPPLKIDTEALIISRLLSQHLAITGKVGAGKTFAAKVIVEGLLEAGRRVCVIDPTGVWWGLRSSADGRRAGYPVVVFGGDHADVPINEHSGEALATLIADQNLPAVIDLSDFTMGAKHRFMTVFIGDLHRRNKTPLHLIIDEADEFAPQNPLPESRRMLHVVDRIVRRGRVKGFRILMITQRPAVIHKNVLAQANALVAMRLTAPQDRKAIGDWIEGQADKEQGKAVLASLPRLRVGEAWLWAPEHDVLERIKFPRIKTFDSSRTPEDDEDVKEPARLAEVDLSAITKLLQSAAEEVKASDPAMLRRRIGELEAELRRKKTGPAPTQAEIGRAEERGAAEARKGAEKETRELRAALGKANATIERLARLGADIAKQAGGVEVPEVAPAPPITASATRPPIAPSRASASIDTAKAPREGGDGALGAERRILGVLVSHHPARFTKAQWATQAGLSGRGGTFNTYLSRLRVAGCLDEDGGLFAASSYGLEVCGGVPPAPQTPDEIIETWRRALGPGAAGRVLMALAENDTEWWSKEELAAHLEMTASGGTFNTYLSRLRSNGLLDQHGDRFRLSRDLFERYAP